MATLYTRTIGSVSSSYHTGGGLYATGTITLKLVCTYTQTASNNTSSVSIYVRAECTNGAIPFKVDSWSITGNGPTGSGGDSFQSGTRNFATKTKTLTHGLGGGCTFSSGAKAVLVYYDSNSTLANKTFTLSNVSYSLPTINVYSTLAFSPASPDMASTVTLTITKANSSAFVATGTKITATYDGTTVTVYEGTGGSTTWAIPDLSATTPNSDTKAITFKIQSIRSGTYYTAKEYTLNVKVPAAYVPSCAFNTITDEYGFSSFIANYSHLTIALKSGTAGSGASIVSYSIEVRDTNASGSLLYSATNTTTASTTSFTMPDAIISSTTYIKATITDSRGRTGTITRTVSAVAYQQPQITLTAERCQSDGTADPMGAYAKVVCNWSITQISTDNQISGTINIRKSTNGSSYSTIKQQSVAANTYSGSFNVVTALATSTQGWFYVTIADNISSVTSVIKNVPKAILPFSLFDNGSDVGASVGQMSSEKGFHVYLDTEHRNHYVNRSAYPSSSAGFVVVATFTINATYIRGDVLLRVMRFNGTTPWEIAITWGGGNTTDPTLQKLTATDKFQSVYLYKKATSTWQLIIEVASGQPLSVLDYQCGYDTRNDGITVDFTASRYASLPGTLGTDLFQAIPWSELYLVRRQLSAVDLNTITEAGTYYVYNGTTALNFPSGVNGSLIVIKNTSNVVRQIFFRQGSIDTNDHQIWTRQCQISTNTWGKWQRIQEVVEEGTSGNWNYRKYADGKAECWKTVTGSVAITTSYSGGFYRSAAIGAEAFPDGLFNAVPAVFTGVSNTNGTVIFTTGPQAISATNMGGVVNVHVGSGTYNCTNSFHAIGKWY